MVESVENAAGSVLEGQWVRRARHTPHFSSGEKVVHGSKAVAVVNFEGSFIVRLAIVVVRGNGCCVMRLQCWAQ